MDFISLANIGSINMASAGLLNNPLAHHLITHEIVHLFFSLIRGSKKKMTRAQRRKLANRRQRWFTDNIIMHHKRLHDRNREIVINSVKDRIIAKRLAKHTNSPQLESHKWRDRMPIRDRGKIVTGRIDTRRLRARSRWLSVTENQERDENNQALINIGSSPSR